MSLKTAMTLPRLSLCTALVLSALSTLNAQSVATAPVGAVTLTPVAQSDTVMALPLEREAALISSISSVNGSTINTGATLVDNQFVRVAGTQNNTYFVKFTSGAKAGLYFTVIDNDSSSLTIDLAGDTLSAVTAGDTFKVVPFWTFGTLFPSGSGVTGTTSHSSRPTEILFYDHSTAGINKSPSFTYYYFTGTNPGWRRVGGGLTTVRNDDIIPHDSYFIYRQNSAQANTVIVTGAVPVENVGTYIGTIASGVKQDNYISFTIPQSLTLSQTNLAQSGAFVGSASHSSRADELLVFDYASSGLNKSPIGTYYYFTGSNPGWRKVGGGLTTVRDSDVVLQPGQGAIIRKAASATPSTQSVAVTPPYTASL
jgi:uncharacterized protein (TIGR02597 family)